MKRILIYSAIILSAFAFCSCGDDDENSYYVKYEVQTGKQISYAARTDRSITYTDTSGDKTITVTNQKWEGTFGPFKKGQKVHLSLACPEGGFTRNTSIVRLSVSKNKDPFVIKAEERDVVVADLSYKIDF